MLLRVEVTDDDIRRGRLRSRQYCPVARALKRKLPRDIPRTTVQVNERQVGMMRFGGYHWADLPADVGPRITQWDVGEGMMPFTFDLDIPEVIS